jgi:hypothetical protein
VAINTDLTVVFKSLKAKSPEQLTAMMLANNISSGMNYAYKFIQHDGKDWVAWYMADCSDLIRERMQSVIAINNTGS